MEKILSTYRLQFHKEFRFSDFEKMMDYLRKTGISTIYASPIFKAVSGSNHGYDILDPNTINPEIGTFQEFENIIARAKSNGFTWLQDIVPNHMAFFPENPWIQDVLEKGPHSIYTSFFDISQGNNSQQGKLMVPFLGSNLDEAITEKEIKVIYHNRRISLAYYDSMYPVQPRSYYTILANCNQKTIGMEQFLVQLNDLHHTEDQNIFHNHWNELLVQFESLMLNEKSGIYIKDEIEKINNNIEYLASIANEQHYRLCHWQETDAQINYRRFFTVNSLICLNIQDEKVLEKHHEFIFSLVNKGMVNGLRIDHIDGLADPEGYLQALKQKNRSTYIVVEKILEAHEELPRHWPVQGTTGYDFLSQVNNLLTDKSSEESFTRFYNSLVQDHRSIAQQVRDKKALILYHHMGGELENLYQQLMNSGLVKEQDYAEIRTEDIKTAIAEFLIHCPVYRYYGNSFPVANVEQQAIHSVFLQLKSSRPDLGKAAELLEKIFLDSESKDDAQLRSVLNFYQRCMQFSGPLMAKGVEDTLMYTYNRFIAHNEVGDAPSSFGISSKEFHKAMGERQKKWPGTLNTTSTHDTKKGEDVRARLNVLSQLPQEWISEVQSWMQMNKDHKTSGAPDVNDEYFIYQVMAGSWPQGSFNVEDFKERLQEYFTKALREAKRFSTWTRINEKYEAAVKNFINALLSPEKEFFASMNSFVERINDHGIINSLVQLTLKCTCPGIPDIYQGSELWDLSLVDPDNRRPVDYTLRNDYLLEIEARQKDEGFFDLLWEERSNAKIKLWLTTKLLQVRTASPAVFLKGDYIPLKAEGKFRDHVFSFARKYRSEIILVIVPLQTAQLAKKQEREIFSIDWEDTKVLLPENINGEWTNILSNQHHLEIDGLLLKNCMTFPVALLKGSIKEKERGAGILLHISSLPSAFGIGDLGPEAYAFADQLNSANQKYWQILPLNPVEEGQGFSPYSATSSFAGNLLLISPEKLVDQNLLTGNEIKVHLQNGSERVDFTTAGEIKNVLLQKAFQRFKHENNEAVRSQYLLFRERENYWLEDFELFMALKEMHEGKPWYRWPKEFALRNQDAMELARYQNEELIEWIGFTQFIFDQQWQELKSYCNKNGISIMGDLPFYVSYDSADVWSHRELFKIDEEGNIKGVAGVPPDAFSADGQLWGMPVYQWDVHKEKKYEWWKRRLERNNELFNLLRLDHFRAFEAYWEVEAGELTAKKGKWVKGPGKEFFEVIKSSMSKLPFIAEDLGEITPEVYKLRDEFSFPGMKVLQFAFGENFNESEHIPHLFDKNFIAYTGTHDNNTILGWLNTEADEELKSRIRKYAGIELKDDEIPALLCRMAYGSVAKIVILPLQDVLQLDENSRMNIPSLPSGNWSWRLVPGQFTNNHVEKLKEWTWIYDRN